MRKEIKLSISVLILGIITGLSLCIDMVNVGEQNFSVYDVTLESSNGWPSDGLVISTTVSSFYQYDHRICSDGLGGAIITWTDDRSDNGDINCFRSAVCISIDP